MPVTLEEIANLAGVSRATASRALHGTYPVKVETKQRICQLAKELDYQPNLIARSLRTERTGTIGLIVDDITSGFSTRIIRGIHDYLQLNRFVSIIINTDRRLETEIKAMRDLLGRSIDGIILIESYLLKDNQVPELAGKPYVFVHRLFNGGQSNCVKVDERYGTQLAVEHLISLGHKRIAHISGPPGWDATGERLATYQETLTNAGLPYDEELVRQGNWMLDSGYAGAKDLISNNERPTAIFAANDPMAVGAIYAIQDAGLQVPDDIAVMGYDDQDCANITRPKLSTVSLPCYAMGYAAAELLIQLLNDKSLQGEPVKVRGELIIRQSSGSRKVCTETALPLS
jgi:DNA-binding LacI/PurR family transcriptional regulator